MSHPSTTWILIPDAVTPGTTLDRTTSTIATGVDWAIDLDTGDLLFPLRYTTGLQAVAQGIRIRLLSFKGEWFADLDDGVPYLARDGVTAAEAILGQKYDEDKALAAFRKAILTAPGVNELSGLVLTFNATTRSLTVSFNVRTSFGVITVNELEP